MIVIELKRFNGAWPMTKQFFTAGEAAEFSGVAYANLDYWARSGFLKPSVTAAKGSGSSRRYSFYDVVALSACRYFRDMGVDLSQLDAVVQTVRAVERNDKDIDLAEWIVCHSKGWVTCPGDVLKEVLFGAGADQTWKREGGGLMLLNLADVISRLRAKVGE